MNAKLIIDTNILVAAMRNRDEPAFALLQQVRAGNAVMCCSTALFLEYEDVLMRPEHLMASGLAEADVHEILAELASLVAPVLTHYQWRPQLRDPADEMVLEAAVNGGAGIIVTYNLKDFAPSKLFGILTLNPAQTFNHLSLTRNPSTNRSAPS